MQRESFNDGWKVWRDTNPFELVFRVPEEAMSVTLPYDAMFHESQKEDSVNKGSTGFLDGGAYKYYKEFFVPEDDRGQNIFLRFEGIYKYGSVFINQSLAGQCAYGYTDFYVKANDYLKYGQMNEILVTAKCPNETSRWYCGAGIYRDTWMYRSGKLYLQPGGLRLTTLELDGDGAYGHCIDGQSTDYQSADGHDAKCQKADGHCGALVKVEAAINNTDTAPEDILVVVEIVDKDGHTAVSQSYPVRVKGQSTLHFRKNMYLENVRLWSATDPQLYTVQVALKAKADASVAGEAGALPAAGGSSCAAGAAPSMTGGASCVAGAASQVAGEAPQAVGAVVLDCDSIITGVRKLTLDSRHGLRVNGQSVKLRGACIHHDQGLLGAATYGDYEYRRVRLLKEAGFNAVRSAHNPASQALMDACDALGVYVMDELTDAWNKSKVLYDYSVDFEQSWERDVEAMVRADYNHPSVIMYSTGNEIFDIWTDKGFETSRMLGDKFHQLDSTRYTTNGVNGAFAAGDGLPRIVYDITGKEVGRGDVNMFMMALERHMPQIAAHEVIGEILEKLETTLDIVGYNYMTGRYLKDAAVYPDRLMVGTETYPKQIAENWDAITRCPAALGDFTWTGWDYMGEVAPVYPSLMNLGGDISIIGERRPVSYYREIVFGLKKGPVMAVQNPDHYGIPRNFGPWCYTDCTFNYNYEGCEGKPVMIQVYGGGDSVELFVNGKSLGVQPCSAATAFETQYNTVYEPGELVAVAYENGVEIGRNVLRTTKTAARIRAVAENRYGCAEADGAVADKCAEAGSQGAANASVRLGRNALGFVNMELLDADGLLVYDAGNTFSVQVEGPAVLTAFGSEKAIHQCGFEQPETVAGNGRALAIIKTTGAPGQVTVRVSGDGLEPAVVTFEVL